MLYFILYWIYVVATTKRVSLEDFMENMTMAENMIKHRQSGYAYADTAKLDIAIALAEQVGVDLVEWWNTYFDHQRIG